MPMQNGIYVAPTWVNNAAPAIDADELQAMSDTIQGNQTPGVAKVQLTQALQSAFGLSSSQQLDALLNILSRAAVLNSGGDELQSVLGDTLLTIPGVRIATGSYVGTGTYGSSNPNSLTFDFDPKFVMICDSENSLIMGIFCFNSTVTKTNFAPSAALTLYVNVTWGENTLSWYNSSYAVTQLNNNNNSYVYIAIG